MGEKVKGNLIIIGGAEDKTGRRAILKHVSDIVREKPGS
ncbi:MAG: cyanophycinase, partial [Clostridiaceae bacterium]|nr:cyanophycinase [Clostridiaceae bacterium]